MTAYLRRAFPQTEMDSAQEVPPFNDGIPLFKADGHVRPLQTLEADIIRLAIRHYGGQMSEVARRLGIGRSTLYRKLSDLGIDRPA